MIDHNPIVQITYEELNTYFVTKIGRMTCVACGNDTFLLPDKDVHYGTSAANLTKSSTGGYVSHHDPSMIFNQIFAVCNNCGFSMGFSSNYILDWVLQWRADQNG